VTPRRVAVVGSGSCAGKTTFARKLAAKLGVRFVELDAPFWGPNWTLSDRADFRERVVRALEGDAWVVEGNYGSGGGVQRQRADTLVWLGIPFLLTAWRVIARSVRRTWTGEELWNGDRESLRNLLGRDSLLWHALRWYGRRKRRFEACLTDGSWSHLTVHRFRSNQDADRWIASLAEEKGGRDTEQTSDAHGEQDDPPKRRRPVDVKSAFMTGPPPFRASSATAPPAWQDPGRAGM